MSFGGLLASLIGFATLKGVEAANQPKTTFNYSTMLESQPNLPPPCSSNLNAPEWIDKLEARFNAEGKVVEQLLKEIDYQPLQEFHDYKYLKREAEVPSDPNCCFDLNWRVPTGIKRDPAIGGVSFGFGLSTISVWPFTDRERLSQLDMWFSVPVFTLEDTLECIRTQYWKPNTERFEQWCHDVLPQVGVEEEVIELYISKQVIPVDNPCNDVIYRTPEEIEYFDKVAERLKALVDQMVEDAKNFCYISNNMEPTDRFYNEELGTLSYSQWK